MRTERILTIICLHFNITRIEVGTKINHRDDLRVVEGKQAAAYSLYRHTDLTLDQIANILGYASKNNINMAKKKVKEIMSGNKEYRGKMEVVDQQILRD